MDTNGFGIFYATLAILFDKIPGNKEKAKYIFTRCHSEFGIPACLDSQVDQTGKLGGLRRDLGGATAVKSKGTGEKSDPGAARGAKTNAAMYMSNEYRYLKSILFNYYADHGTGVHCVDVYSCNDEKQMGIQGRKNFPP